MKKHNTTENKDWTAVCYPTPSNYTQVIHVTTRNVKAIKKCCYVFQCADTLKDFQFGKNASRENVGPKGFLDINKQIITIYFFSPKP